MPPPLDPASLSIPPPVNRQPSPDPPPRGWWRSLHPAEWITLGTVAVVAGTIGVAVARGVPLGAALLQHAALLVAFAAASVWLAARPGWRWTPHVRGVAVIGTMFTLYSTLGHVAFDAIPWLGDSALDAADRALMAGRSPSLVIERFATPGTVEFLSFFYAAFIPFLYMSILLGLVGRPDAQRDEFVTAFAILYGLSFLGYLFVPARGPIVHLAGAFAAPLAGGTFHDIVVRGIDSVGGPHGAFPSLHVGASFLATWFDLLRGDRLRGMIYVPLVLLIAAATLVLRYHYVVDLLAGVILALFASHFAPRLLAARERRPGAMP